MKSQKTTIIKPERVKAKEAKKWDMIAPIFMLIIGIILFTNSSTAVVIVCYIIGTIGLVIGGYNLLSYSKLKKELNVEDTNKLILGISAIAIGLIVILLSSAIETFLRFIIGVVLISSGIKKAIPSIDNRNYLFLIEGIIFIALGLYTILAENIVFTIIGLLLIISSIMDLINYYKEQKNKLQNLFFYCLFCS